MDTKITTDGKLCGDCEYRKAQTMSMYCERFDILLWSVGAVETNKTLRSFACLDETGDNDDTRDNGT